MHIEWSTKEDFTYLIFIFHDRLHLKELVYYISMFVYRLPFIYNVDISIEKSICLERKEVYIYITHYKL